jgi:tetratricopeptide (TPR) repeat protein
LKKALELAPTDYRTNLEQGNFLLDVSRVKEAIGFLRQAAWTEPLLLSPTLQLGRTYFSNADFEMALKEYERGKDLIGPKMFLHLSILVVSMQIGDRVLMEEALENTLAADGISDNSRLLNNTMASLLDAPEVARAELQRFYADPAFTWTLDRGGIAFFASYFGDPELSLKIHHELFKTGGYPVYVIWEPVSKEMRRLPGCKVLVRDLGLFDYWRTTGNWGDFCRSLGHDDFECE